jgi:hypothetical protein
MSESFTYHVDVSNYDAKWRTLIIDQTRSTLSERDPKDVARAILEDWIVDHPGDVGGAERVEVHGDNVEHYPDDLVSHVRVWIFRGPVNAHEAYPAAAAYLVDRPEE